MPLAPGYHDLPPGMLAAVVTDLEMRARPAVPPDAGDTPWTLRFVPQPTLDWYRALFRHVGADWLWSSRLVMPDANLAAILASPEVEVHALVQDGREEGLLELDFREAGACEIAFFGVSSALMGRGAGRWLMARALERAWSRDIARLWLHTCSLDAPQALPFYRRAGFTPVRRRVEVLPDPRLTGALPGEAAPQVPLLGR